MPRFHFPYHNYLGPGSDNFNLKPIDEDDAIARSHDLAYNSAQTNSDIHKADKETRDDFLNTFISSGNVHGLIGGIGLGVKNFVEENVLGGRVLYGMGKRKPNDKDWGKINRINKARAAKRQRAQEDRRARDELFNHEDEANLEDFPDFLQEFINNDVAEAGTSGTQPVESAQERPIMADEPSTNNMETEVAATTATPQVDPRTGGQAAGGMNTGGAANDGRQDIFAGAPQPNQHHELIYGKSYHFTLTNGLPDFRHSYNTQGSVYFAQQRFKHIHGIPWERLLMYLSEGEAVRMFRDYTAVKVEEVVCEVYSLGVRLPFITSATTSSVANANAQYPIGCYHFDKAYETTYDALNVDDVINKAVGAEWKNTIRPPSIGSTNWSENFPNITASATSRDINNPVIVNYPLPYDFNNAPKDVGIYDYVDIKNGTTAYGKCWEKRFKPINGILYAESTLHEPDATLVEFNNVRMTPIPGLENGYFMNSTGITERNDPQIRQVPKAYTATKNNVTLSTIGTSMVDYMGFHHFGEQKTAPQAMPKFLIGFVNIRNEDNTLLTAKWDILVKTRIRLTGLQSTRDWISRTTTIPPQWFTSQYAQFRYQDPNTPGLQRAQEIATVPTRRPEMFSNLTTTSTATGSTEAVEEDARFIEKQKKLRHKSGLLPLLNKRVTRSKK